MVELLQGDAEEVARVLHGLMQAAAMQEKWTLRSLWLELEVVNLYDSKTKVWVRKEQKEEACWSRGQCQGSL